jgi:hypothetical protein
MLQFFPYQYCEPLCLFSLLWLILVKERLLLNKFEITEEREKYTERHINLLCHLVLCNLG